MPDLTGIRIGVMASLPTEGTRMSDNQGLAGAAAYFAPNPAMEVPAIFINQFQVLVSEHVVRIAFAEGFAGQPINYRAAMTMSVEDARTLAFTILGNIPPPQPQPTGMNFGGVGFAGLNATPPPNKFGV